MAAIAFGDSKVELSISAPPGRWTTSGQPVVWPSPSRHSTLEALPSTPKNVNPFLYSATKPTTGRNRPNGMPQRPK